MKIIAIHGEMGAGKDTVGAMLAEMFINESRQMAYKQSFALAVKENVSNMTGIPMVVMTDAPYSNIVMDFNREQKETHLPNWNMTLGKMLQIYATEAVRDNLHQDAWILSIQPKLMEGGVNIITDLRFPNEIHWLNTFRAVKIKVIRDTEDLKDGRDKAHRSEAGLHDQNFDFVVLNDDSIESLRGKVEAIYETIKHW